MPAVQGEVSHDNVDIGSPVKIGGKAVSNTDPTAVAGADRVDAWFDVQGALVTEPRPSTWVESASSISSVANAVCHASTSGQTHYLTGIQVAFRTAIYKIVDVYDGANIKFSFHSGANPNVLLFPRPIKMTQGNEVWATAQAASAASGECYMNLFGYTKDD